MTHTIGWGPIPIIPNPDITEYRYTAHFEDGEGSYRTNVTIRTNYPDADRIYGKQVIRGAFTRFFRRCELTLLSVVQTIESEIEVPLCVEESEERWEPSPAGRPRR